MRDDSGHMMHTWARDLFPICRSLTGPGVRQTLEYIRDLLPRLEIRAIPSGTRAFDWTVPEEWIIKDAFIADDCGRRVVDFQQHNLHVVGYSVPVNRWLDLKELQEHLYSLPDQPEAVPYVTSYYERRWGFCLSHNQRQRLKPGQYRVYIDSELKPGVLNYAELILPGESQEEVLLSTYICHPSMANNELSGPVVTAALGRWLAGLQQRRYTYRIVFVPETIGSIVYISQHLEHLKNHVIAGFNVTCVGDERCYSYLPSRAGNTLADRAALHVLGHIDPVFKRYTWLDRGSDERQYCAPGVDLPVATIMRSKYGEYPEYHTSLDDLSLVTPEGLEGGYIALRRAIEILEKNENLQTTVLCEPQLGRRGLYPTLGSKEKNYQVRVLMDFLSFCDGKNSTLDIAERMGTSFHELINVAKTLKEHRLVVSSGSHQQQ